MNRYTFPAWRWLVSLALVALVAAACAPGAPPADPSALVVVAPRGPLSKVLEAAAAAYTASGGGKVRVEALGGEDYAVQVNAALLAGLERYDLVYFPADELAHWAAYRAIQPLTLPSSRAALAPWLAAVTVGGEIYGVPTQPDPTGLWYRADLLESAGLPVPRDWEAFRRAAQALNAPPGRYGAAIAGSDLDAGVDFAAVLAGFGGQAISAGRQVQFAGEPAQRALTFYAGLLTVRSSGEAVVAPGVGRVTRADVLSALRDGRAALGIGPFSAGAQLLDCAASPQVCQDGKPLLAWTWLPGLDERMMVGSLGAWAVPLRAAHAREAQRLAAWLAGEAGARAWAQAGGVPVNQAVLAAGKSGLPGADVLARVAEFRPAFPPVATVGLLWKASNSAVNAAVSGKQAPAQALETAADQMRAALRQAGNLTPFPFPTREGVPSKENGG